MASYLRSGLDKLRDQWAPVSHISTFRSTGQITPEEFLQAGDFLVYKFPSWSWADAAHPSLRKEFLPEGKQFLVTRGVPCRRRLDADFAGDAGHDETVVRDGPGMEGGDEDGWLRTGGMGDSEVRRAGEVRTMDEAGKIEEHIEEEEIPDMEDEEDDDEAIIRDPKAGDSKGAPFRTYTIYITYTQYYRTPRIYLSGYSSPSEPIAPHLMMEDIVGDYKEKTVTLEDFPYFESNIKMASIHPCKHASVMKVLLDRADAALKIRLAKLKRGEGSRTTRGLEGLVDDTKALGLTGKEKSKSKDEGDEWEVLQAEGGSEEDEVAIRVDQYLIVFLKFMASVTPGIEHDFTMGV